MIVKPNKAIWARVNPVIMGESLADVIVTFQSAMGQMLIAAGVAATEEQARAHLAAILLSPDTGENPGALMSLLQAEIARIKAGLWSS
jgi:hypothetical protein